MTNITFIMCMYYDEFYFKNPNYLIFACLLKSFKSLVFSTSKKYFKIFDFKKGE